MRSGREGYSVGVVICDVRFFVVRSLGTVVVPPGVFSVALLC